MFSEITYKILGTSTHCLFGRGRGRVVGSVVTSYLWRLDVSLSLNSAEMESFEMTITWSIASLLVWESKRKEISRRDLN